MRTLIESNPHLSIRDIEEETGIPNKTVWRILSEVLQMHNVMSYWVPLNLTNQQKQVRVDCAKAILQELVDMGEERFSVYAVEDETLIRFDLEHTRQTARVWKQRCSERPQIAACRLTPKKALVMIALTANKRFNVKPLPYGETVDGDTYLKFVQHTGEKWRCLRRCPVSLRNLHWQHDNARPHVRHDVQDFFLRRKVQLIRQSPYSPDLNILDRWVNEHVKKELRPIRFTCAEEVEQEVLRVLNETDEARYRCEIDRLMTHCQEVIDVGGCYVTPIHTQK